MHTEQGLGISLNIYLHMLLKWVIVVLTLTHTTVGSRKCELEKCKIFLAKIDDEFEEIVNYFRLRDYTIGGNFEGYPYPPNSISDFSTLLKEKLNCEYDSLETLLFTAFRYCGITYQ
ncbi:hypothetical protein RF11_11671 [Thelohanellus kitauei]|uniref:Uncharacterized protein n=1 Tax=Thelohanellus kitauei TaxID=669202 RepID=A0A0C2IAI3_THEKT|nr:hypothetical protein RF11_11671 [Thelohanellus kitauei]